MDEREEPGNNCHLRKLQRYLKISSCISVLYNTKRKTNQISIIVRKVCKINLFNIKPGLVEIPLIRNEVMSPTMNHVH